MARIRPPVVKLQAGESWGNSGIWSCTLLVVMHFLTVMYMCVHLTGSDRVTTAVKLGILFYSADCFCFLIADDKGGGQKVGRKKRSTSPGDGRKVGRFIRSTPAGLFTATNVIDGDLFPPSMVNDLVVIYISHVTRLITLQWTAVGDDLDSRESGPGNF